MKVRIAGRHYEVSDRMRSHIEKEAAKLERFFDRIIDCQVLVGAEKQRRVVEVLVNVHAHTFKATREGSSVYQVLEEAMDRVKVRRSTIWTAATIGVYLGVVSQH